MKKILFLVSSSLLLANSFLAQDSNNDFDKKFRFGLRVAAEPTWLSSNNNFTTKGKAGFGFGFGLVTEFKLSDIVHFQTGIGGDFEKASVTYKNTAFSQANGSSAFYALNSDGDLIEAKDGVGTTSYNASTNHNYLVTERKIKATYVTVPLLLKMMTKEISGLRYFGMFGGELGIRTGLKADDQVQEISYNGLPPTLILVDKENSSLDIGKDGSLIPLRFGLNVGLGTEYRISGSTALFINVNYFHSFTNTMRKDSKYMYTKSTTDQNGNMDFSNLKQGLMMRSIRINLGVMF